ncbi:MAG: putative addiction module antidote protein [Bdellovibrio sp.]|nr:MAG: putative addiction module antidote protein [Bdellovibrio sp.]
MPKRAKKYDKSLIESLKDPKEAAAYLNEHLEDDSKDSEELFLLALRDVAKAHGFGDLAKDADLGRESLYKALSADGNPKISTLRSLLKAMGLRLAIELGGKQAS